MKRPSITVSETAKGILSHLHPELRKAIRKSLDELMTNPYAGKPLKQELSGLWSLPVARHRIIYQTDDRGIIVVLLRIREIREIRGCPRLNSMCRYQR